jgi:hypothetical protein
MRVFSVGEREHRESNTGPNSEPAPRGYTRREFSIALATGAVGIVGYCLFRESDVSRRPLAAETGTGPARPTLRRDVTLGRDRSLVTLSRPDLPDSPVCAVNGVGRDIILHLDGRHAIEDISRHLAHTHRIAHTEALKSRVAWFVAELGMLGFLAAPFYAQIVEYRVTG